MRKIICTLVLSLLVSITAVAHDNLESVRIFLQDVIRDNHNHMATLDKKQYSEFAKKQTPRATVVMCSDSRIQNDDFKMHDVNDLFVVRNIGNQMRNGIGSVEYGIHFLGTPILLIVGHSGCGAIQAIVNQSEIKNANVERELESLHLHHVTSLNEGILENVHHQVEYAMKKFKNLIAEEKLVVIGAIDDFQNIYSKGIGRFIIININGETNPKKILSSQYLKDVEGVATLE